MGMMGDGMVGAGLMGLFGLLLLVGLIAGLLYLAWSFGRGSRALTTEHGADEDRALALLRGRYARGEIDHGEYEQRRTALANEWEWAR